MNRFPILMRFFLFGGGVSLLILLGSPLTSTAWAAEVHAFTPFIYKLDVSPQQPPPLSASQPYTINIAFIAGDWQTGGQDSLWLIRSGQPGQEVQAQTMRPLDWPNHYRVDWSPNGEWIAYGHADGLMLSPSADPLAQKPLTLKTGKPLAFAWSLDSQKIAFVQETPSGDRATVRRVDIPAGHAVDLMPGEANYASRLAWSPDGRLTYLDQFYRIVLIGEDEPHPLAVETPKCGGGILDLAWSADGRWVAVWRYGNGRYAQGWICVTDTQTLETRFVETDGDDTNFVWDPHAPILYFGAWNRDFNRTEEGKISQEWRLMRYDARTGDLTTLLGPTPELTWINGLRLSPDGQRVGWFGSQTFQVFDLSSSSLDSYPITPQVLFETVVNPRFAWTTDGSGLVFFAGDTEAPDGTGIHLYGKFYLLDLATGTIQPISDAHWVKDWAAFEGVSTQISSPPLRPMPVDMADYLASHPSLDEQSQLLTSLLTQDWGSVPSWLMTRWLRRIFEENADEQGRLPQALLDPWSQEGGITPTDIDGDGRQDYLVRMGWWQGFVRQVGELYWVHSTENETTVTLLPRDNSSPVGYLPTLLAINDVDGDGGQEIVYTRPACDSSNCETALLVAKWNGEAFDLLLAGDDRALDWEVVWAAESGDHKRIAEITGHHPWSDTPFSIHYVFQQGEFIPVRLDSPLLTMALGTSIGDTDGYAQYWSGTDWLMRTGQLEEAAARLTAMTQLDSMLFGFGQNAIDVMPFVYLRLGLIRLIENDSGAALSAWQDGVDRFPTHPATRLLTQAITSVRQALLAAHSPYATPKARKLNPIGAACAALAVPGSVALPTIAAQFSGNPLYFWGWHEPCQPVLLSTLVNWKRVGIGAQFAAFGLVWRTHSMEYDLNRDGQKDMLGTISGTGGQIYPAVLLSDADGYRFLPVLWPFPLASPLSAGVFTGGTSTNGPIAFVDLDKDGRPELLDFGNNHLWAWNGHHFAQVMPDRGQPTSANLLSTALFLRPDSVSETLSVRDTEGKEQATIQRLIKWTDGRAEITDQRFGGELPPFWMTETTLSDLLSGPLGALWADDPDGAFTFSPTEKAFLELFLLLDHPESGEAIRESIASLADHLPGISWFVLSQDWLLE